ncbi:ATP-dependent helicase [Pseudobdellovibrio exovorus]|uniref:DNA 3'-5' helicase n=1 Tax=Pseudobdellovibrio exovorus JSS TaxID=1184267 RepID=M4V9D6_9BACT|nr:UvrD-helicase domain-containing protein [Pseudobdellovibrio exovorus]AGH95838.1 ATP-dependent DNA helicase [Pseudobdellovibrio exovorus JSS]
MDWYEGLNPEQCAAVAHNYGPLLILAGAGSGKTTVLVSRTGRLIAEGIAPASKICVLTFTNKAARELKHRVQLKIGAKAKGLWAGTFHSFGLQLLRKNYKRVGLSANFGVLDQSDTAAIIKELVKDIRTTKEKFDADKLANLINLIRAGKKLPPGYLEEYHELAEVLAPKYEKRLKTLGVTDFEGLLLEPLRLFKNHPEVLDGLQNHFSQIMVDEFQDTNLEQLNLINAISSGHKNLTVVGDDDQSIYGWRGAEINNILNFPHSYENCEVVKLERNYRSVSGILDLGNEVISKNAKRHGKILRSTKLDGSKDKPEVFVLENEDEESDFVVREITHFRGLNYQFGDIAILYRSNTQGAFIESALRRAQIPYAISGGTSIFDRKEAKDWLAYLKQSIWPDEVSLRRIINTPPRGIGETTLDKLTEFADKNNIDFQEACKRWKEAEVPEKTGEAIDNLLKWLWTFPQRLLDDEAIGKTISERFQILVRESGYRDHLAQTSAEGHVFEKRWQVIEIVGRIIESFVNKRESSVGTLKDFIDAMLLRDDPNEDTEKNQVQLMTMHASKGLEFPAVILVGVEEDLLPHKRLGGDIDEERRLFYVGITRAQKKLTLTYCRQRKKMGQIKPVFASRFLSDCSKELYEFYEHGSRPISGETREAMVSDFLKKLSEKPK